MKKMNNELINNINKSFSVRLGWTPDWFGVDGFNDDLIEKIKKFQFDNKLEPDSLCGDQTFKKIYTEREAKLELVKHQLENKINQSQEEQKRYIDVGWNNKKIEIKWDKFIGLSDKGNLALPSNTYRVVSVERKPQMVAIHHDACLSSKSCYEVLIRRGLSAHFLINNDASIFQCVSLNNSAWHIGSLNMQTIGIEVSNAASTQYNGHYKLKGFGEREIKKGLKCNGSKFNVLCFYPKQIEALKVLVHTLCEYYQIPLEYPKNANGTIINKVYDQVVNKTYRGVIGHFQADIHKWDPIELNFDEII